MKLRVGLILAITVLGVMLWGVVALATPCTNNPCKGTNGNDTLTGDERANQIYGLGGDDQLKGGGGRDYLNGGNGTDWCNGNIGKDRLINCEVIAVQ
jgi:Ca2+-binding RTX toxin-like protein